RRVAAADANGVGGPKPDRVRMRFPRHGSRRPPDIRAGAADEVADFTLVEAEGHQRRGAIAGQAVVLAELSWQILELLFGCRLLQPAVRLDGALVGLVFVQPVIGLREADRPRPHAQKPGGPALRAAYSMPAALEEEDPAPGIEAVGHQRGVIAEEIDP